MTLEELRAYCLSRHAAEESTPFGPEALVYKVMGKMFALIPSEQPRVGHVTIAMKCDPYLGQILRDAYPAVFSGYHLNKKHWIEVSQDGSVPDVEVREWIDNSYALVVKGLTRAKRQELKDSLPGE